MPEEDVLDWPVASLMVKRRLLCSLWGNEEGEEQGRCNHVPEEDVLDWPAAGLMVKRCLLCSLWGNEEGEERGCCNHVPEEDGAQAQPHQLWASPYNKKNLCDQCLLVFVRYR